MNYKFKSKPFAHQSKALEMSWDKEVFAYFMEMGTGKSKVLIDNIAMLYNAGKINGALIIAPKGVYKNWFDSEIPNHLPDYVEKKMGLWKTDPNAKDLKPLFSTGAELHILIMNVEAFSTKKGVDFAKKFLSCHKTIIGIDESTTIKNPMAKRTRAIIELGLKCKFKRILTGSPVTKSPLDLFSQCYFLSPFLLGHESFYTFKTRYAITKQVNVSGRMIQLVVGYRNLPELSEKVKPFSYRVLKDDCLDLPKKTYMKRIVQLTDEQKRLYKTMKEKAIAFLNGKMVSTAAVITQLMRLHQITCGHFVADDGSTQELKSNRLNELMEVIEEIEGKAIIWAHYQHDIKAIVKEIEKVHGPGSVVDYYGLTLQENRQKNIKQFQENDKCRFIVGTPQTGGYGITLTQANTVIYYSNGYDLEKRLQSEDRAHRIGQKKSVTYVDILAEDTVDEKIVKALRKKIDIASQVMGEELKDWI